MKKHNLSKMSLMLAAALLASNLIGIQTIAYAEETTAVVNKMATEDLNAYTDNQVIVQLEEKEAEKLEEYGCKMEYLMDGTYLLQADSKDMLKPLLQELKEDEEIAYIQPNYTYHVKDLESMVEIPSDITEPDDTSQGANLPNDTYFTKQWALYNDGSRNYQNIQCLAGVDVGAVEAWKSYQGTNEVVVAVIDTGVDYNHEDLKNSMWVNPGEIPNNGIDDDGNGYIDDVYGWDFYNDDNTVCHYGFNGKKSSMEDDDHGTHCAGSIAAQANNGIGIAGVASNVNVKIMSLKILGGRKGVATTDAAIRALMYAKAMGADLINASWGATMDFDDDKALFDAIQSTGILMISASGNDGTNNDVITTIPAAYSYLDNVLAVGSVDCNGVLSDFSNYGKSVDFAAPGRTIASTIVGGYANMSGTSMSAPIATGVAAMVYGSQKNLYPKTVKELLLSSCKQLETINQQKISIPGIIYAPTVLSNLSMLKTDTTAPVIKTLKAQAGGKITIKATDNLSGVCSIAIAKGNRKKSYFQNGTKGSVVKKQSYQVKTSGTFTVYVRDNAGNETVKTIEVDRDAPVIKAKVSKKTVNLTITDNKELALARYASGSRNASYFKKGQSGIKITIKNKKGSFKATKAGVYTVYAIDKTGNESIKKVTVK